MKKVLFSAALTIIGSLASSAAFANTAFYYNGVSSNGSPLSVAVDEDGSASLSSGCGGIMIEKWNIDGAIMLGEEFAGPVAMRFTKVEVRAEALDRDGDSIEIVYTGSGNAVRLEKSETSNLMARCL